MAIKVALLTSQTLTCHFFSSVWPSSCLYFDLWPLPSNSAGEKPIRSELMVLKCSFLLRFNFQHLPMFSFSRRIWMICWCGVHACRWETTDTPFTIFFSSLTTDVLRKKLATSFSTLSRGKCSTRRPVCLSMPRVDRTFWTSTQALLRLQQPMNGKLYYYENHQVVCATDF